jgi:hypothetical protein
VALRSGLIGKAVDSGTDFLGFFFPPNTHLSSTQVDATKLLKTRLEILNSPFSIFVSYQALMMKLKREAIEPVTQLRVLDRGKGEGIVPDDRAAGPGRVMYSLQVRGVLWWGVG